MRRFLLSWGGAAAVGAMVLGAGCEDRVPTFPEGQLPGETRAQTVELLLSASEFVLEDTVYDGFSRQTQLGALVVASDFGEGAEPLQANALGRFPLPDTVVYTRGGSTRSDSILRYVGGELTAVLQRDRSQVDGALELSLFEVGEAWDTTATWQHAARGDTATRAWQQPGGTRGALLARTTLSLADTAFRDTLRWAIDSVAMQRLADGAGHGVLISADGASARLLLTGLSLRADVRPAGGADTTVSITLTPAAQRFVFSPEPPLGGGAYAVAGIRGARSVLTLRLPENVPACPPGTVPACGTVRTQDARLNQVALLLTPERTTDGFRPVGTAFVQLRRLLEPELGRFSPLGVPPVGGDSIPAASFVAPQDTTIAFQLSPDLVRRMLEDDTRTATLALLGSPEGAYFGLPRFRRDARLRIVYTIVPAPTLP